MHNNKRMKVENLLYDDEHIYENEGEIIETEKDIQSLELVEQQAEDEIGYKSAVSTWQKVNSEKSKLESQKSDFQESNLLCVPAAEPDTSDDSLNEVFGFGTNKKV